MKSRKKRILGILFSLALMVGMICAMSQAVYAVGYEKEWSTDQTISESVEYNGIRITNDITIRIEKDVTLTVNGSIAANSKTLTVKGPGKLVVNGAGGNNGISGNINVKGAEVEIIGKPGSDGTQAYPHGTDGGWAVYGDVVVYDGSISAIGGNGGNGADGGDGGCGGFGIYGKLTVTGGFAFVSGGNGGSGTFPGDAEVAVSGSLTNETGTIYEESDDGETSWTRVTGGYTSSKQYVRGTGPNTVNIKLDVGANHADLFDSEMLIYLEEAVDPCDVSISGDVITFTGVKASTTEADLWDTISGTLHEKGYSSVIDDNELWFGVGFKSFDKYATFDDFSADINDESHEAAVSEGFTLYLLWVKAVRNLDLDNGSPICGKEANAAKPALPKGTQYYVDPEDPEETGYTWFEEEEEIETFVGGREYICKVEMKIDPNGALWKNYFSDDLTKVTVKGGQEVEIDADTPGELYVTFKATADHDWDEGTVTKQPTTTEDGEKVFRCKTPDCEGEKTEVIPKLNPAASTFITKLATKGKNSLRISWNKVKGADGYDIFFAPCNKNGKKMVCKNVKSIKGNNAISWTKSGLKKGTAYKAYVKAYVMENGQKKYISTSPQAHAYAGGHSKKFTNAKSVTVKKAKVSLKKGKTYKIKAKVKKLKKSKSLMPKSHVAKLRYMTSNAKVATVSKSGKITAKGKGKCTVIAFAHNGVSRSIKVTVK